MCCEAVRKRDRHSAGLLGGIGSAKCGKDKCLIKKEWQGVTLC